MHKPFVAAFININESLCGRWAEQNGIGFTSFADLSQNPRILELIRASWPVNALLPEGSRMQRFINLPKELDPDEDELTRTRKLRRRYLEQKYSASSRRSTPAHRSDGGDPHQVPGRTHRPAERRCARH